MWVSKYALDRATVQREQRDRSQDEAVTFWAAVNLKALLRLEDR
jgi:hypothetical protein